eukprot:INCI17571.3.p1 GENE.INCI17571.3~~INCI17571.3.p1  ORF type:complete len:333 (-),score=64.54 INCI17571.3:75-1073(-)
MVALTERLNERDEQIIELQEELDAYDRRQKELEERLDAKTAQLIHLQRVTVEHNEQSPYKSKDLEQAALGRDHWLELIEEEANKDGNSSDASVALQNGPRDLTNSREHTSGRVSSNEEGLRRRLKDTLAEKAELEKMLQVYMGERVQASPKNGKHRHAPSDMSDGTATSQVELAQTQHELAKARQRISELSTDFRAYQDRMEARLRDTSNGGSSPTIAALQNKINDLTKKLEQAQNSAEHAPEEAALLRERCATHVKERRAVLTIMEQKIKRLVANAGQEARSILLPPSGDDAGADPVPLLDLPAGQRLSRELKTLSRLVNASIAALKNSAR